MSTQVDSAVPSVNPRPGVVKTLGILNIVFAVVTGSCLFYWTMWLVSAATMKRATAPVQTKVVLQSGDKPTATVDPFIGMRDASFLRFCAIDTASAFLVNGVMLATGIGLVNLRRWAARWWSVFAWIKIIRLVPIGGYFIVAVAPSISENMARSAIVAISAQQGGGNRGPTVAQLTQVYSVMLLVFAVLTIVLGSIYPAVSIWLLGRPGVKAALVDKPSRELEYP